MFNKLNEAAKNILRKVMRRGYEPKFTYVCSYIVDPADKSLSPFKRNLLELMPLCAYKKKYMNLNFSERIVEIPFALQNVPDDKNAKILEIGCADSPVAMYLSNLGYKVTGVDLTDYRFSHPNFKFFKKNFFDCSFSENSFDAIILISTIEHVGLAMYGNKLIDGSGDIKLLKAVHKVLKPGGIAILTTPYGHYDVSKNYRVYDETRLGKLFEDFESKTYAYYKRENLSYYELAQKNDVDGLDSTKGGGIQGLVCAICRK